MRAIGYMMPAIMYQLKGGNILIYGHNEDAIRILVDIFYLDDSQEQLDGLITEFGEDDSISWD